MRLALGSRVRGSGLLIAALIGMTGCQQAARYFMENKALTTGPNGSENPGSLGVPYQRLKLSSSSRYLDSYVVRAPVTCLHSQVILIYHGVQETISFWAAAQRFLFDHCIASVVFDYTGSGDSSRPARFEAVNEDAVAVYEDVRQLFPNTRIYVLGHSMGNGPMLQGVPQFSVPPSGIIVASAFSSIRDYGGRAGKFYRILASFSPDWWNNVVNVRRATAPLLVIHSDQDAVNPLSEGKMVFTSAPDPKQLIILHGFPHNAIYRDPSESWWQPVLSFVSDGPEN